MKLNPLIAVPVGLVLIAGLRTVYNAQNQNSVSPLAQVPADKVTKSPLIREEFVVNNSQDGSVAIVGRPSAVAMEKIYGKDVSGISYTALKADQDSHWLSSFAFDLAGEIAKKDITKHSCVLYFRNKGIDFTYNGNGMNQTPYECTNGLKSAIQLVLTKDVLEMVAITYDPNHNAQVLASNKKAVGPALVGVRVIVNPLRQTE